MPRRPPPSALLLHNGPLPNRNHPKHILPLPPLPILCSQTHSKTAARLTAPTNTHLPPQVQRHTHTLDFAGVGLGITSSSMIGIHTNDSTSSVYSLGNYGNGSYPTLGDAVVGTGRPRSGSDSSTPSSSPTSTSSVQVPGPWEKSRMRGFSYTNWDIDALVPPPKPVVPNPTPLW
jgi:hypothetical protein